MGRPTEAGDGGEPAARYPVLLDLDGRPCLVVGGGPVAARRVAGLRAAGASVTVVAPDAHPRLAEVLAADDAVRWEPRAVRPTDHDDLAAGRWAFVIAATDDPGVNRAVVASAQAAGTWANDASDPAGGPATIPAVHRDGPVTLAVSTGGVSPSGARWLRGELARSLAPEHLAALRLIAELRREHPDAPRFDWRCVVASGTLSCLREGREAEAKERLERCLSSSSD